MVAAGLHLAMNLYQNFKDHSETSLFCAAFLKRERPPLFPRQAQAAHRFRARGGPAAPAAGAPPAGLIPARACMGGRSSCQPTSKTGPAAGHTSQASWTESRPLVAPQDGLPSSTYRGLPRSRSTQRHGLGRSVSPVPPAVRTTTKRCSNSGLTS